MSDATRTTANLFDPAALSAGTRNTRFRGRVHYLPSTGSTNTLALEAAAAGEITGIWIADEQTAGRGRGGHGWHSLPGEGLYQSTLVTADLPADRSLWLSLAAGMAAQTAIRECAGLGADLRWPNDLLLRTGEGSRKVGGILVESALTPGAPGSPGTLARLRYAVIGIGINVSHAEFPPEIAALATSLRLAGWAGAERQQLALALVRALDRELDLLEREIAGEDVSEGSLLERFTAASTWVSGKRVSVPEQGGYTGVTAGLDERGFLRVSDDKGALRTVLTGGVRDL